jgi:short-subunit dehydrogenase
MTPDSIVVTGASRGIGAALARKLAAPGRHLVLTARALDHLEDTAEACRAAGASIRPAAVDVGDGPAMAALLAEADSEHPIDCVFANAGIASGSRRGSLEPPERAAAVIRTNLEGVVNTVAPLIEPMLGRGRGRIGQVASVAGLIPLPDTPAYSASKAGLITYGKALDATTRPHGVTVTVLCPGFVVTDMAGRYRGRKPWEMSAERAAAIMVDATLAGRRMLAFPWPLALLARLGAALPPQIREGRMAGFRASIDVEEKTPR